MATVKYPNGIDTDAEIPRVEDNISEIGGEAINQLRAAVFAIEKALGVKPQGTAADLAARLGVSLDNNGNIKASALSGIGLVTLPVTNAQVGSAAGIEETKLDLDYGTALLKSWIDSLKARVDALEAAVALDIAHLSQHVAGTWGRHSTGDVDAYGVFAGKTAQGALTNLDTRLNAHISDPVDAHDGSAISLDATRFSTITATDVQSGVEQLEDLQLIEIIRHRDRQHGNGILGTQDAFAAGTRHGVVIIPASATTSALAGDTSIKFSVAPDAAAFQSIARNDRIDLTVGGRTYTFTIDSTQSTNQVNVFGSWPVSGSGIAAVYRNAEETTEPSVAMVCVRKDDLVTRPSTLQVVHPASPYVLSSGFRGSRLSGTTRNLRLLYPNGDTGNLDVYAAMTTFCASPTSTWTVDNVVNVLNYALLSPGAGNTRHPLVAFAHKGELGFAYDLPDADGYVAIGVPTTNDATTILGFVSGTTGYAMSSRELYIDGYETPSIRLLFDAHGKIEPSGNTITFPSSANPLAAGVEIGHLARVSVWARGTYVISGINISGTNLVFDSVNEYDFSAFANKLVRVRVYADAFSVASAPSERTLYETFLDGYSDGYGPVASFRTTARATYADTAGGGASLETVLDMTAVSRTFGSASRRLFYNSTTRQAALGDQVAGPSISNLGLPVTLPSSSAQGFRFTLYDANGVDYFEFEIAGSLPSPGSDGYLDITSKPRISEERFLQLATVLHNKVRFKHLKDTRQFGSVGRQDVRDDFTRDYISYPQSLLRGNGVIYGFVASGTVSRTLKVAGGQALVNGQLKSVGKTTFPIPSDGAATYNLFMDTDGALRLLRDNYFSLNILSTPSLAELLTSRTETVLAQVVTDSGSFITSIIDLRRFVNDIDSKLDLLVEENNITHGSFASLKAAVTYLSSLPSDSPCSRIIRVRGEVFLSESVSLPDHVVLAGDGYGLGGHGSRITFMSSSATIVLGQGAIVRDLAFYRSGTLSPGFLSGTSITGARIENCGFEFAAQASGNIAISCGYLNTTKILGCRFKNVGKGIWSDKGSVGSQVVGSLFSGIDLNAIVAESISGAASNMLIAENAFDTASFSGGTAGAALIRLESPWGAVIRHNAFTTSASSGAAKQMLHIEGTSFACKIEDNGFGNTGANVGFLRAIWFDGTSGSPMHMDDSIVGNVFLGFSGVSGGGAINLNNANGTIVSSNIALFCRTPLAITESNWIVIDKNDFPAIDDAPAINIAAPTLGEHFIITNNFISNANVSANSIVVLQTLSGSLPVSTGVGGVFTNNTVQYSNWWGTTQGAAVYVDGHEWHILNNEIGSVSILGWFGSASPLTLTANAHRAMVMFNNMEHAIIVGAPSKIGVNASATRVVEMLNRGVPYAVTLELSKGMNDKVYDGWVTVVYDGTPHWDNVLTTDGYMAVQFGQAEVPPGATITEIAVSYSTNDGGSNRMICYIQKFLYSSGDIRGTALVLRSTHLNGTSSAPTLTALNLPTNFVIERPYAYNLLFQSNGSISGQQVYGVRITYVL